MDWVEERAQRDRAVHEAAPDLWADLCSAFEEAVKSMQRLYENAPAQAEFFRVSENKIVIRVKKNGRKTHASLTFNPDTHEIYVGVGSAPFKHTVTMDVENGRAVLKLDGKTMTPDKISQFVLEPIFFGEWSAHEH